MISRDILGERTDVQEISIVVPSYNEERFIGPCLDAVRNLDCRLAATSVIVVDNGSTDGTARIVGERKIRLISDPESCISGLRNHGARMTSGNFLGFVDADCLVSRDWASHALQAFTGKGENVGIVGAPYSLPEGCSWIERAWSIVTSGAVGESGPTRWLPAGNMVVRRTAFEKVGGFDDTLVTNEDVDFCDRIRAAGFEVLRDDGVRAVHLKYTTSLGHFFRRQRWHGSGAWDIFFRSLPEIRNGKVVAFTLVFLLSVLGLVTGTTAVALGFSGISFIWTSVWCLVAPPIVLGTAISARHCRWRYAPGLSLLFLFYVAARATSLLDVLSLRLRK
jgi:GT2 family glycosyltransferase